MGRGITTSTHFYSLGEENEISIFNTTGVMQRSSSSQSDWW